MFSSASESVSPTSTELGKNTSNNNNKENEVIDGQCRNVLFKEIRGILVENPQAIPLPAAWICQVITTVLPCIMWIEWTQGYKSIAKRIVLFPDMTVHVSNYCMYYNENMPFTILLCSINCLLSRFISKKYLFPCSKQTK